MKILLLRHGETIWNIEGRLQGRRDIPLTDNGMEQIRTTGAHLAASGIHIDHIISSPLQRAHKSAEIIAEAINYPAENITTLPLLLERGFGECEGFIYEDAIRKYPDGNYPGMETLEELYARAEAAIDYLEENYSEQTILVASHGGFIKSVLGIVTSGRITYFDKDVWIDNGTYCLLEKNTAGWKVSVHDRSTGFAAKSL